MYMTHIYIKIDFLRVFLLFITNCANKKMYAIVDKWVFKMLLVAFCVTALLLIFNILYLILGHLYSGDFVYWTHLIIKENIDFILSSAFLLLIVFICVCK